MIGLFRDFLTQNIHGAFASLLISVIELAGVALLAVVVYYVVKSALYLLDFVVKRTENKWDDDLLDHRLLRAMAMLAPALTVNWILPDFFVASSAMFHWVRMLTLFYIVWTVVHLVNVAISNLYTAMSRRERLKSFAVKGVFQMLKLISIGIGVIVALSVIVGRSPLSIITAIGASAAVLMLVFRDTILGLVASVQLTANKMLHRGDWITAPRYDVNGEVLDVSLTTVKVRNWDNSISTIPPYSLVSDSFRNYQAMRESGGRRVERAVTIDFNSVRFLSDAEIDSLRERGLISTEPTDAIGAVNVSLLRLYIERYLFENESVNKNMTCMVRELEPTPHGLPVQLYFFTKTVEWTEFEHVQASIMDHIYAAVREFGLEIYQMPSGKDVSSLSANQSHGAGVCLKR